MLPALASYRLGSTLTPFNVTPVKVLKSASTLITIFLDVDLSYTTSSPSKSILLSSFSAGGTSATRGRSILRRPSFSTVKGPSSLSSLILSTKISSIMPSRVTCSLPPNMTYPSPPLARKSFVANVYSFAGSIGLPPTFTSPIPANLPSSVIIIVYVMPATCGKPPEASG